MRDLRCEERATKAAETNKLVASHIEAEMQPVIDVAYMIKRHLSGVLSRFFAVRITNEATDG